MTERPIVGKFYMVPCVYVQPKARTSWMPRSGWVPVLGPKHTDSEHLEFSYEHFHVDWRFIPEPQCRHLAKVRVALHGTVITDTEGDWRNPRVSAPVPRRIKCKREMPDFPQVRTVVVESQWRAGTSSATRWARLERAQAITCNRLKPGNICPHRGIDLTPFIKEDGTVVCPGHGLRWDTKTGELLPYQGSPW